MHRWLVEAHTHCAHSRIIKQQLQKNPPKNSWLIKWHCRSDRSIYDGNKKKHEMLKRKREFVPIARVVQWILKFITLSKATHLLCSLNAERLAAVGKRYREKNAIPKMVSLVKRAKKNHKFIWTRFFHLLFFPVYNNPMEMLLTCARIAASSRLHHKSQFEWSPITLRLILEMPHST